MGMHRKQLDSEIRQRQMRKKLRRCRVTPVTAPSAEDVDVERVVQTHPTALSQEPVQNRSLVPLQNVLTLPARRNTTKSRKVARLQCAASSFDLKNMRIAATR